MALCKRLTTSSWSQPYNGCRRNNRITDLCRSNRRIAPLEAKVIQFKHKTSTLKSLMCKRRAVIRTRKIQSPKFKIQAHKLLNMYRTQQARLQLQSCSVTERKLIICQAITTLLEQRRKTTIRTMISFQNRIKISWWHHSKAQAGLKNNKTDRRALNPQIITWSSLKLTYKEVATWIVLLRRLIPHQVNTVAKANQVARALLELIKWFHLLRLRRQIHLRKNRHRYVSYSQVQGKIREVCTMQNCLMSSTIPTKTSIMAHRNVRSRTAMDWATFQMTSPRLVSLTWVQQTSRMWSPNSSTHHTVTITIQISIGTLSSNKSILLSSTPRTISVIKIQFTATLNLRMHSKYYKQTTIKDPTLRLKTTWQAKTRTRWKTNAKSDSFREPTIDQGLRQATRMVNRQFEI